MPEIMDNVAVDGTVTATRFIGPLTGTASRASADASGNGISSTYATKTAVAAKQDALVSGTNIKTVNGESLLGSGDITIGGLSGTVGDDTHPVKIVDGAAVAVTDALATQSALNGKENTISPTVSQIGLGNYGFTYGSVYKFKVNDKMYVYNVYDGNKSSTGKVYIDTAVKSGYNPRGVLMGTNYTRVSGLIGCDSSGVYINVLVAGEWLIGQVVVILT